MRVIVAFESMYGSTRAIATAIASGFDTADEVTVIPVSELGDHEPGCDVLVLGSPTHAHGLPRPATRRAAVAGARSATGDLPLEPSARDSGVREWMAALPDVLTAAVAAFDTRFHGPAWLVGHPARRVLRRLSRSGGRRLAPAQSFFVNKKEQLRAGELDRAHHWGAELRQRASSQEPLPRHGR